MMQTQSDLRSNPSAYPRPHVVILGAGASRAALQAGDKNGKKLPLMDDLPEILGESWTDLVVKSEVPTGDFEYCFSWIRRCGKFERELSRIEVLIQTFFESLELPEHATPYDYLVLGLRKQDVIATFNWDPLLLQALRRNRKVAELPDIRFLHGCVSFATCNEHDVLGVPREVCPLCDKELTRGKLLFPDDLKDYTADAVIKRDWIRVKKSLGKSFHLTIFGYAGPASDFKAKQLLLTSWNATPLYAVNHIEIIDIADHNVLKGRWADYFPHQHDILVSDFWESSIARFPRRTAEWKLAASLHGVPSEDLGPYRTDSLADLQRWFGDLAQTEVAKV